MYLIISCVFPPEPVVSANLSFDLATALSIKNNITVISPVPSRPMGYDFSGDLFRQNPFNHSILASYTHPKSSFLGRFRESYSFGKASAKFIADNSSSITVVYMNTWPLFGQYFAVKAAQKFNISTVVHIQDIYPEAFTNKLPTWMRLWAYKMLFPIERFVTTKSTRIVTISNGMKNLLVKTRNLPETKVEVVFNWQDESKFFVEEQAEHSSFTANPNHFMFLGSLGPAANVDNLVRAFALLKNEEIRLTIAGEGSEKTKLLKLVHDLNAKSVVFMQAPASDAGKIQATANILLLSLKKGAAGLALPSKLPAYMFSAKPIIATVDHDSDTANAIREAGCGWVIEPENPAALAALMQEITTMPKEELHSMGMQGREYALKHFSKQANLAKLIAVIEQTAKK